MQGNWRRNDWGSPKNVNSERDQKIDYSIYWCNFLIYITNLLIIAQSTYCFVFKTKDYNVQTHVTCEVKVKKLETKSTWYFARCTGCEKELNRDNGQFYCGNCKRIIPHPDKRFNTLSSYFTAYFTYKIRYLALIWIVTEGFVFAPFARTKLDPLLSFFLTLKLSV